MDYQNIFKRYEIKYLLNLAQQQLLFESMKQYMVSDSFGKSTICNIYFDTPDKRLIRRSLEGPCYKEKLRVRSYGVKTDANSTVFIELKKKYKGVVYKRRLPVCQQEAFDYFMKNIPLSDKGQISKELDYFIKYYEKIEPSMFLCYEREAFFSKTHENFRMTFDRNILMRDRDFCFTAGGTKIIPQNMILLEVKTPLGIPQWLLQFLSQNKIYKTSFSKYGTGYTQILSTNCLRGRIYVA